MQTQNSSPILEAQVVDADDRLMDTLAAATYLGCSKAALEKWRSEGGGPQFIKLGGMVRYRRSAVDRWLTQRTVSSTTGARRKRSV